MSPALTSTEALYFNAQANLNDMLASCPDQASRDAVLTQYVALRQNYWMCINRAFHDDDPELGQLVVQADACADELDRIDQQLGDISKVIGTLTEAVTIGARIVAKVIAL